MSVFNSLANPAASPPWRTFGGNALAVSVQGAEGSRVPVKGKPVGRRTINQERLNLGH